MQPRWRHRFTIRTANAKVRPCSQFSSPQDSFQPRRQRRPVSQFAFPHRHHPPAQVFSSARTCTSRLSTVRNGLSDTRNLGSLPTTPPSGLGNSPLRDTSASSSIPAYVADGLQPICTHSRALQHIQACMENDPANAFWYSEGNTANVPGNGIRR